MLAAHASVVHGDTRSAASKDRIHIDLRRGSILAGVAILAIRTVRGRDGNGRAARPGVFEMPNESGSQNVALSLYRTKRLRGSGEEVPNEKRAASNAPAFDLKWSSKRALGRYCSEIRTVFDFSVSE
jgi:hypothetical protein